MQGEFLYQLARIYENGLGVSENQEEAAKWYEKAAESGHSGAIKREVHRFIETGIDDYIASQMLNWCEKVAETGDVKVMKYLAEYYDRPGADQDAHEAAKWYEKAAKSGDSEAMNKIGDCYLTGKGVTSDDRKAVGWYKKGAEEGNVQAMRNLSICYEYGRGVFMDYGLADEWSEKADAQKKKDVSSPRGINNDK